MAVYFGEKIKAARKAANMTQKQLAGKVGVAHTTISNWEKNSNRPDPDQIELLCGALNISPSALWGIIDNTDIPPGFIPLPEFSSLPRVGNIACGTPILAEQNIESYDNVPKEWNADFTLICSGDSMMPKIQNGDIVAIQKTPNIENGEIAAVRIDDEATLKHLYRYPDRLVLQPTNPQYAPIVLIGEEMNRATIEGKAVGLCRDL